MGALGACEVLIFFIYTECLSIFQFVLSFANFTFAAVSFLGILPREMNLSAFEAVNVLQSSRDLVHKFSES